MRVTFKFEHGQRVWFIVRKYSKSKKCRHCKSHYPVPDGFRVRYGWISRHSLTTLSKGDIYKSYGIRNSFRTTIASGVEQEMVFSDVTEAIMKAKQLRKKDKESLNR